MLEKSLNTEVKRRRRELKRTLGQNAIAIIPAAPIRNRNRHLEYAYRQESDFYYLTGFEEPEAVAVLIPGRKRAEYILFLRDRDLEMETWNGRRVGVERAAQWLGCDDAFPISDIDDILPGLMEGRERIFYQMGKDSEFDQRVMGWLNSVRARVRSNDWSPPSEFVSLEYHLHEMRLLKSKYEQSQMGQAAAISCQAHRRAMAICQPGINETELEAELIYAYKRHGGTHAYLPIVGGGENACILHYNENNTVLNDGDLVLIDSGCELNCYASDITRTFPVNGTFSDPQRELYELVLEANRAAIAQAVPGNHWNDPHDASVKVLTKGLVKLGLLSGKVPELIKSNAYKAFYMHRVGHWLGLDTHDVGDYKIDGKWRLLESGMTMTIEPGLYIGDQRKIPKAYRNTGIRIEDNLVLTADGHVNLTKDAPVSIEAIEALVGTQVLG